MKLKKLGAFAATGAMALALALTGCGSSNATSGSDAGSSSSDDAKVEKVDGSKEYALVKDGTLTVGTSAEYAPFEYKDDNGDYQGFDLELIVTKVDNTDITADNYSEKLNNADATIIVQSGSTAEAFAQENFPKAKIVPYKDATECFSALQSDKGDAVVTNRSVASQLTAEQFNTCQTIKQISTGEEYAIAINQGNTKLKDDINQAIKDLTDDGTVDALMAKYNIK